MRWVLRVAILASLAASSFAAYGLGLRLLGYETYGAFGGLFRASVDPTMSWGVATWIGYFAVSVGLTIWLCLRYRRVRK